MAEMTRLISVLCSAVIYSAISNCTFLPPIEVVDEELAIPADSSTVLGRHAEVVAKDKASSYFHLLPDATEAMKWRLAMIDAAEQSIDIQTFIWENDRAGDLLFDRIIRAAKRGVRVRILIDDIWLKTDEVILAAYEREPNISIRLYNPLRVRGYGIGRWAYFLANYSEMNHRLHSKVVIADGAWALNGGRNIGDKYFGLSSKYNFRDLDLLTTGAVVNQISDEFDEFWNSSYVYPARFLHPEIDDIELRDETESIRKILAADEEIAHLPKYPLRWEAMRATLPKMHGGDAKFVADVPGGHDQVLEQYLSKYLFKAQREVVIVSPYFIPYQADFDEIEALIARGVRLKLLVPSLGANNHLITHSHYRKYRRRLLEIGCEIYEYRHDPDTPQRRLSDSASVMSPYLCLHKKALVVDRRFCYIGSLNMDPRALEINAESGLIIDSRSLAKELYAQIEEMTSPSNAWQVFTNQEGGMRWRGQDGAVLHRQPARTSMQRFWDIWARWIPIEAEL